MFNHKTGNTILRNGNFVTPKTLLFLMQKIGVFSTVYNIAFQKHKLYVAFDLFIFFVLTFLYCFSTFGFEIQFLLAPRI